ncbi:hypothetical protein [Streptomyces sp. NPDC014685]
MIKIRKEEVSRVEDWAEIRRLHRAEQMPMGAIAQHLGHLEEHGEAGAGA